MGRLDVNRAGEMEVFVRVVEQGSFSGAARLFAMTPSAVSKLVARLEARLGVRLLHRSTRQLQLTAEGRGFFDRSLGVLADLDEAERGVLTSGTPRGPLRVSANFTFAEHFLIPLSAGFLATYPEITLDLELTDEVIDILEARTDIAVRAGPLKSSSLVARKLGQTDMVVVAAPSAAPHGGARSPSSVLPRRGGPNGPPDRLGRARRRRAATRATIHPLPLRSGPLRARASMVWSPPVAEHAEAAFCGARAAWATP